MEDLTALSNQEINQIQSRLPDWKIIEQDGEKRITRTFKFKNFQEAMDFANEIGKIAEEGNHHPAILVEWGKDTVTWWTHKIGGLGRSDVSMAEKTDQQYQNWS